jgi:hypothetical protein
MMTHGMKRTLSRDCLRIRFTLVARLALILLPMRWFLGYKELVQPQQHLSDAVPDL